MTYNFEEPEFPDAPKLAQFGLVPEDYGRLADAEAELAPIEKAVPMPIGVRLSRWAGYLLAILLIALYYLIIKAIEPKFPLVLIGLYLAFMIAIEIRSKIFRIRYQSWCDRLFASAIHARNEKIRAHAPELVQRRDELLARITAFEDAHALYYRNKGLALVGEKVPVAIFAHRKRALLGAYEEALKHYRTKQRAHLQVPDYFP